MSSSIGMTPGPSSPASGAGDLARPNIGRAIRALARRGRRRRDGQSNTSRARPSRRWR